MLNETPQQFRIKTLPGMNSKYENLELQDKWVELAQNCRFEQEPGAIDKRDPVTYYNSTSVGTGAVTGLYRFYSSSGTIKFIMIHGTSAYVGDDATGTWTEIRADLTDGKRMSFETYRDLCIMSNGYDNPFVYDGASDNVTWELGACKAVLAAGGSNLDSAAEYSYKITFDNDTYVFGAVSNTVTTDASNRKVTLSNIPLGPAGTVDRKIYRTEGGGTSYKLVATISDNSTQTYLDDIDDGSLTTAYPAISDTIPKGSLLKVYRERLFIAKDPNNPNRIYYSGVYIPHFLTPTTELSFLDVSPNDGDEIMGFPIHMGAMYCIKKNTIRPLHISSATSGADPATWYADDPISFIGSPAQWSIVQTPFGIIFLGWDHWYKFDGASVEMIIDEFDTDDILDTNYSDTVGFYSNGVFMASYTDKESAAQYHNRIMRHNFKRNALSIDVWTSSTLSGANCFTSKSGDDENGEVYFGDSQNGYIVKEKNFDETYRLSRKVDCNAGTKTDIFVGGTETSPYIEIGATTSATAIPDDVIIFWDDEVESPGTGWVDITATYEGKLILFGSSLTTGGSSGHTHTMTGTTPNISEPTNFIGDMSRNSNTVPHGHTVTTTLSDVNAVPRHVNLRVFKSSGCTDTEFPKGAILLWDQATAPIGWMIQPYDGYYIRISATDVGYPLESNHTQDISVSLTTDSRYQTGNYGASPIFAHYAHTHTATSETTGTDPDLSGWELDYVGFTMIKKIGDSEDWDGVDKYIYAPCLSAPSGWTIDSTYDGRYLKCKIGTPSTGDAANTSHTHYGNSITSTAVSDFEGIYNPGGGTRIAAMIEHTHFILFNESSSATPDPEYVQLILYKYVLGKMRDYNTAIETSYTSATWVSPSQQISAETLLKIYWNETLTGTDDVNVYTRTGVDQATCEAASWSAALTDPNGSSIASTADVWFQYKIVFTATDSTVSIPRVYLSDGYVVKYTYSRSATVAETAVSLRYKIGFRNLDTPMNDKSFKKIIIVHEGSEGSITFSWETENADDEFLIGIPSYSKRWESYFQDTAMGRDITFEIQKNDLYSYRIKEFQIIYTEQPMNI
jgi:hypothetical protein